MDPPEHTRQRRMLTHEFLVKRMARIRPEVDALVDSLIDDLVAAGPPADLMALVAQPLPATITCRMLGVPREDEEFFQRNSQRVQDIAATPQDVATALGDLAARLDRLTTTKAADPGDDLISRLVVEQEQPGHLSRQDVVGMALNLLIAGHETTANMIGLGVLGLHEHGQWDVLVRQPELVPSAVEELLRHQSIVPYGLPRVAVADIEIGDVTIKAGEGVLVQVAAANRDPRVFADPDRIDVRREARHHLGFGFGVHQCLGQPLARVELQSVLAGLLRRLPNLKLPYSSAELDFKHEMNVYGLFTLPVEW